MMKPESKPIAETKRKQDHRIESKRLYTRRQINQDRMIFGDFSVNSEPIFFKFCEGHFLFKS